MNIRAITPKLRNAIFSFGSINGNHEVEITERSNVFMCNLETGAVTSVSPICTCESDKFNIELEGSCFDGHYFCWECGKHYYDVENILVDIRDIPFIKESKYYIRKARK